MVAPVRGKYHDQNHRRITDYFRVIWDTTFIKETVQLGIHFNPKPVCLYKATENTGNMVGYILTSQASRLLAPNVNVLAERSGSARHSRPATKGLLDAIHPYRVFISGIAYACADTDVYSDFRV